MKKLDRNNVDHSLSFRTLFSLELNRRPLCERVKSPVAGGHMKEQTIAAFDGDESKTFVLNLLFNGSCEHR